MDNYLTAKEAAKHWDASEANVRAFCKDKSIADAVNCAGRWFLPADSPRSADLPVLKDGQNAFPLGAGSEDYREFSSSLYYVDKTLLIKDIIDSGTGVYLFTRPWGFGKSLNMDMLKTYFY